MTPRQPLPWLLRAPWRVRWGVRIDTAPGWLWLAWLAAALWPSWWWMARRLADGSDDPLGVLALAALALLVVQHRGQLRAAPDLGWLAAALALGAAAIGTQHLLPPLPVALVALLSVAAALLAFLPRRIARAPVLGLAVLALPLLASLQFYAGYPLRVLTAEASRWLLAVGHAVHRDGASLWVDGRLVIVDAPCSGVQMAWFGYFTACAVALLAQRGDRAFLLRLPAVGALVLAGNIVRNTVLVAAEARGTPFGAWGHEAVGLLVLAAVCAAIAAVMGAQPATAARGRP